MADTIYALATPPGRSGVAVIRASGPHALAGLAALTGMAHSARALAYRTFRDPVSSSFASNVSHETSELRQDKREVIDHGVAAIYIGPKSFTGEDVVEYQIHGGPAIIARMLGVLSQLDGHRMAEPGEFTRRAFENGKIDLTEAEAVADLIDAETDLQRKQALSQLEGGLSELYTAWMDRLKKSLAYVEADMEFPDEDMPGGVTRDVLPVLEEIKADIAAHLDDNRRGERLRDGIHIAVIGAPNAGKSTLVNALAQRDVAIVSDMAGTTRDVIEVHLNLAGYPVIVADTAGLRPDQIGTEGHDAIESEGIRRALERAESADLKILLYDGREALDSHTEALIDEKSIVVANKIDDMRDFDGKALAISALNGTGLETLTDQIVSKIEVLIGAREGLSLTRQRHRTALEECLKSLDHALAASMPELRGEDVRLAVRAIGRITGRVDVEDLLDVIFRDFCIGK